MGRAVGLIMLLVVVGVAGYVYTRQAQSVTTVGSNPQTTIDVTAVRHDLLALANAERQYFALNGKYASLDELRTSGVRIPTRENYSYSAQTADATFKIIAAYSGPDASAPRTIAVDETMAMTTD